MSARTILMVLLSLIAGIAVGCFVVSFFSWTTSQIACEATMYEVSVIAPAVDPEKIERAEAAAQAELWMDAEQAATKAHYGGRGVEAVPKARDLVTRRDREA